MSVQQIFNCPKCGNRLPQGAKACPSCGHSFLPAPAPVMVPRPLVNTPKWYSDLPDGFRFVFWLVLALWVANNSLQIYSQFAMINAQQRAKENAERISQPRSPDAPTYQ